MKSLKIFKKDITIVIVALAFAIFGAIICATVSDPAVAINEENQASKVVDNVMLNEEEITEDTIDTFHIKFTYEIPDPLVTPTCRFTFNDIEQEYNYGDEIEITGALEFNSMGPQNYGGSVHLQFKQDDGTHYTFDYYTPLGFDVDAIPPDEPQVFVSDTEFKVTYKKSELGYSFNANISDSTSGQNSPVQGYSLKLYDINQNLIAEKFTDASGDVSFSNLSPSQAEFLVVGRGDGLTDLGGYVRGYDYDANHNVSSTFKVSDRSQANLVLKSNDSAHKYFE